MSFGKIMLLALVLLTGFTYANRKKIEDFCRPTQKSFYHVTLRTIQENPDL